MFRVCTSLQDGDPNTTNNETLNAWRLGVCHDEFLTAWQTPTGVSRLRNGMSVLIPKVMDSNHELHELQPLLADVCRGFPGSCDPGLSEVCAKIDPQAMADSSSLQQLCGCFQNSTPQPECHPLCTRSNAIPRTNARGQPQRCQENICMVTPESLNFETPLAACTTCRDSDCVGVYQKPGLEAQFKEAHPKVGALMSNDNDNSPCRLDWALLGLAIVLLVFIIGLIVVIITRR